jgi:hypothetical protein
MGEGGAFAGQKMDALTLAKTISLEERWMTLERESFRRDRLGTVC